MNNKITWADLRRAISKHIGADEKEVGLFLSALVEQIINGLKTDASVRINGIGTFKRQPVAARKSVNVTTGEEMIIEGYNKIAFTPDATIKELLLHASTPKVLTRTIDESTPLQKLSDQADEIVGILSELSQMDAPAVSSDISDPSDSYDLPDPSDPSDPSDSSDLPDPSDPSDSSDLLDPSDPSDRSELSDQTAVVSPPKKYHPLRDGLITITIILLLLGIAFFFLKHSIIDFADSLIEKIHSEAPAPSDSNKDLTANEESDLIMQRSDSNSGLTSDSVSGSGIERTYTSFITTAHIHPGSRLTHLARKYYGEKDCWVFIYEANKEHLTNPHHILIGTPIRIPQLPKEWTDMSNPSTRQMVNEMIEMYK